MNNRNESVRNWIKDRPSLNIKGLEEESGIPTYSLGKLMMKNPITLKIDHLEKLENVLVKYGWKKTKKPR